MFQQNNNIFVFYQVESVTFNSMVLIWKAPEDDGGAPVSNYIIEKRDINDEPDKWALVTARTAQTTYKVCIFAINSRIYI